MADILPSRPDSPDDGDKDPRVVGIDSEEVDDLLAAISSGTARSILAALHEDPSTPSEVADAADTSIQNAQYHLGNLEDAGLIEPAGTAYSEKGREMTVYAPADRALVVVAGQEDETTGLQTALTQLLGGLGVVGLGSVLVDRLARRGAGPAVSLSDEGASGGGAGGAADTATATPAPDIQAGAANATASVEGDATPTATPATETTQSADGGISVAEATTTAEEATQTTVAEATQTTTTQAEATRVATATPTSAPTETDVATETARTVTPTPTSADEVTTSAAAGGPDPIATLSSTVAALSPGELFFLGGVTVLVAAAIYWWLRS
jgi:DNA-binding transcriptional ArsR family regulator